MCKEAIEEIDEIVKLNKQQQPLFLLNQKFFYFEQTLYLKNKKKRQYIFVVKFVKRREKRCFF